MNALVTKIKASRRASAVTVGVGILLVAAVAWVAVVSPKRSAAASLKTQVIDAQGQLVTAKAAAVKTNRAVAAAVFEAMPATQDQPGLIDQLNRIGKSSGVVVATITPNLSAVTPNALALTVVVDGDYFQIRTFLKKLRSQVKVGDGGRVQATGRLYDVSSVNMASLSTGSQLSATLAVNASIYVPAATTAAPATSTAAAAAPGSTG